MGQLATARRFIAKKTYAQEHQWTEPFREANRHSIKNFADIATYNALTLSQESDSVADREVAESNLHHRSIFSLNPY